MFEDVSCCFPPSPPLPRPRPRHSPGYNSGQRTVGGGGRWAVDGGRWAAVGRVSCECDQCPTLVAPTGGIAARGDRPVSAERPAGMIVSVESGRVESSRVQPNRAEGMKGSDGCPGSGGRWAVDTRKAVVVVVVVNGGGGATARTGRRLSITTPAPRAPPPSTSRRHPTAVTSVREHARTDRPTRTRPYDARGGGGGAAADNQSTEATRS